MLVRDSLTQAHLPVAQGSRSFLGLQAAIGDGPKQAVFSVIPCAASTSHSLQAVESC